MFFNTCLRNPICGMLQDGGRTHMCLERGKCKTCWMEKFLKTSMSSLEKNLTEDVTDFKIDSDHNCVWVLWDLNFSLVFIQLILLHGLKRSKAKRINKTNKTKANSCQFYHFFFLEATTSNLLRCFFLSLPYYFLILNRRYFLQWFLDGGREGKRKQKRGRDGERNIDVRKTHWLPLACTMTGPGNWTHNPAARGPML